MTEEKIDSAKKETELKKEVATSKGVIFYITADNDGNVVCKKETAKIITLQQCYDFIKCNTVQSVNVKVGNKDMRLIVDENGLYRQKHRNGVTELITGLEYIVGNAILIDK